MAKPLPVGYVRTEAGAVAKHPDRQVQARIRYVFELFAELRVARRVVARLRREKLQIPAQVWGGPGHGEVRWKVPTFGVLDALGPVGWVERVAISPDGSRILVTASPRLTVWRRRTGALLGSLRAVDSSRSWTEPDGRMILPYHPYTVQSKQPVPAGTVGGCRFRRSSDHKCDTYWWFPPRTREFVTETCPEFLPPP